MREKLILIYNLNLKKRKGKGSELYMKYNACKIFKISGISFAFEIR